MSEAPRVLRFRIDPLKLQRRRGERFLSRRELAQLAGVSVRRIEQIEGGLAGVRPETARRLADALACPVTDLAESIEAAS